MLKRSVLAVFVLFVLWSALDFIIHGVILCTAYEATASLWRPVPEMKLNLMHLVSLIYVFAFVAIYVRLINNKGPFTGLIYGLLFGLSSGISMGFGSYSVMPISLLIAWVWFLGTLVELTLGGLLLGLIIRKQKVGD